MADYNDDFDRDDYGEDDQQSDVDSIQDSIDLDLNSHQDKNDDYIELSSEEESSNDRSSQNQRNNVQLLVDQKPFPQASKVRITNPYLSKYERAIILGRRASQIENGSPIYTKIKLQPNCKKYWSPLQIAQKQFLENRILFIIRRYLPNGEFEDWKISELLK